MIGNKNKIEPFSFKNKMLIMFKEKIVVGKIFSKFQKFFDNELKFDAIILILFEFLSNRFYFKTVQEIFYYIKIFYENH